VPSTLRVNMCSPSPVLSVIYFFSYMLIIGFMLLQMVIGEWTALPAMACAAGAHAGPQRLTRTAHKLAPERLGTAPSLQTPPRASLRPGRPHAGPPGIIPPSISSLPGIIIDNIQSTAFQEKLPVGPSAMHAYVEVRLARVKGGAARAAPRGIACPCPLGGCRLR
jgi:hypothetical protein